MRRSVRIASSSAPEVRSFMPRDDDKNNDSRGGRRDLQRGPEGARDAARGPEKKFAKRGFAGKSFEGKSFADKRDGDKRPPRADGDRPYAKKPYSGSGKPYAGKREGAAPRRDDDRPPRRDFGDAPRAPRFNRDERPARAKDFRPREDRGGEKRPYTPRGDAPRGERSDSRPTSRFSDRKFSDKKPYASREGASEKRPYTPRGEGFRKDGDRPRGDRPYSARPPRDDDRPRGDRPERKFGGDKKFSSRGAPDRGPRKDFGSRPDRSRDRNSGPRDRNGDPAGRGDSKPWAKRDASSPDHAGRNSRPQRDGARNFDKPRYDKPRDDRGGEERPRFSRPREDRPKFDRPREGRGDRNAWQEHPRSEARSFDRNADRPRRDNEDDSKIFAKRPAFGGRGAYRERVPDERRPARPPKVKKAGERIAKVVSRAGLASRRDAEEWIVQGRVSVNGRVINSPALDVTANDVIMVDGKPLPPRERTRLFMFHKPRGLMTTHADPEGRPTAFDNLPEGLPRLISIGRLDFNTEGLLLLTNDGGLARALDLPDTGWLRRYRVRAHGEVTQAQLDELKKGVEVDGVKYGPIDATLERDQGANVWLVFAIREGKNREVRNVMAHLGLAVNRLIRVS